MRGKCKHCKGKLDDIYRINGDGDRFCDDDCYEEYMAEHEDAPDDSCHPYMDDYEDIRSEYIRFLEWERFDLDGLYHNIDENRLDEVKKLIDTIDSIQWQYCSYYHARGDDGIFAWEIYLFYLKMEELKDRLRKWKPIREYEYHMTIKLDSDEDFMKNWWQLSKYLRSQRWNKLYRILRTRVFSEEEMFFSFSDKVDLDEAIGEIHKRFKENNIIIHVDVIDYCDGGCGTMKVLSEKVRKRKRGWFFCKNCRKRKDPKELIVEDE
nr:hypothetical protein [uncultured Bacillus sp.]